jgi:hypothetical protein
LVQASLPIEEPRVRVPLEGESEAESQALIIKLVEGHRRHVLMMEPLPRFQGVAGVRQRIELVEPA